MKFLIPLLCCTIAFSMAALPRITIKGQRMFDDTGKQFFCRGVAYAPNPASNSADPLGNITAIQRDIPILQSLNINCVRIYQFFAFSKVDAAMKAFDAAGIYVILDLYDPNDNINRAAPEWHTYLFQIFQAKINLVAPYSNLLGILAGNEVTNSTATTPAAAYVKAAVRDIKSYIAKKYAFKIPIGYSTADDSTIRDNLQDYNVCGDDSESVDFYGINLYRWCSNSDTPQSSKYDQIVAQYTNYKVPVILTEFGCIRNGGTNQLFTRQFTDVPYIFASPMNTAFSGAIAYEYHTSTLRPEGSYGIVDFSKGETVATLNEEGRNLRDQYFKVINVNGTESMTDYTPTPEAVTCPTKSTDWRVNSTILPPVADVDRCVCLNNQYQCRSKIQNPADLTVAYGLQVEGVIGYICGQNPSYCSPLLHDSTTGSYGIYSMCAPLIRASLIMNYQFQASGSCEFGQDANFQEYLATVPSKSGVCQNYGDSADIKAIGITPTINTVNPVTDSDTNRATLNSIPSTIVDNASKTSPLNSGGVSATLTATTPANSSATSMSIFSSFLLAIILASIF